MFGNACELNVKLLSESTMRVMLNLDFDTLCSIFQSPVKHNKFDKLNGIISEHFGGSTCLKHLKKYLNIITNYWQY